MFPHAAGAVIPSLSAAPFSRHLFRRRKGKEGSPAMVSLQGGALLSLLRPLIRIANDSSPSLRSAVGAPSNPLLCHSVSLTLIAIHPLIYPDPVARGPPHLVVLVRRGAARRPRSPALTAIALAFTLRQSVGNLRTSRVAVLNVTQNS